MAAPALVMATRNPGKIRELAALLAGLRSETPEPGGFSPAAGSPGRRRHLCRECRHQGPGGGPAHRTPRPGRRLRPHGGRLGWRPRGLLGPLRPGPDRPRPPTDADNWGKLLDKLKNVPWDAAAPVSSAHSPWPPPTGVSSGPGASAPALSPLSPKARPASATTRSSGCRSMPPPWPSWGRRSKIRSATGPGPWRPSKRFSSPG